MLEGLQTNFAKADTYPVDGRGVGYSMGYFSAKHLGTGQFYLMTIMDKAGKPLRREQDLSPDGTAERAGRAILVGDGVRPPDTCADPQTCPVEPRRRTHRGCKRIPTDRRTSTSARPRLRAKNPTGCRPTRSGSSNCYSVCTVRRRSCSRRRGSCRMSRK